MDGNSVAGTINLKLRETPKKTYLNLMSTSGYNNLNNAVGNYKFLAEVGSRFFKDKLGAFASFSTESVNRSAQTMGADYGQVPSLDPAKEVALAINNTSLNLNDLNKKRTSAMVNLDYRLTSNTKFGLYGLYNRSQDVGNSQSKSYGASGSGSVNYGFSYNDEGYSDLFQSSLSGQTVLNFMTLDYGLTLSNAQTDNPNSRTWGFHTLRPQDLISTKLTEDVRRTLAPADVPRLYNDNPADDLQDKNLDTYLNLSIPFKITENINLKVKTGYTYRNKERLRDVQRGTASVLSNQFLREDVANDLDFVQTDPAGNIIAEGFLDGNNVKSFLNGEYNFGATFDFNRLNQVTDSWLATSQYQFNQGEAAWKARYPADKLGLNQDILSSTIDDQNIQEKYQAGFLMTEFTIGDWLMFLPGLRYETVNTDLIGFASFQPTIPAPLYMPLPGVETAASTNNEFYLPMIHLRLSPSKTFYTHLAYTEALSRPTFDQMTPNSWTNTGFQPYSFIARDPYLKVEKWRNFDAQFAYHGKVINLVSVTGFYKTVNNQIFSRSYTRIKGDPIIPPFPDTAPVNVTQPQNHTNEIKLKGAEFELQTSFGYLDNWLKYFTVALNYTFTHSETLYATSNIKNITVEDPNGGRPQVTQLRVDSLVAGPMLNQPKHVGNASLGYNKKGLNVWLSCQYTAGILTSTNLRYSSLDTFKKEFYRFDLQVSQKLSGVFKGFQIIGNFANLNDFIEGQGFRDDPRPTYLENYGWTVDLGIRYTL